MFGRVRRLPLAMAAFAILGMAAACAPEGGGGGGNQAPVAVANANPGATSMEIAFSSAGSFDPDGTIVGYLWDFKDGSATSNLANPTHLYVTPGTYVAELTVTDGQGATKTAQVSVTVPVIPNQPPVAVGSATPNEGPAPLLVQFSSAGSNDPDGGVITAYLWDFGDGITSNAQNPTHSYAGLGDFTAKLTVTDSSGATDDVDVPVSTWEAQIENAAMGRCADVSNSSTSNGTKTLSYPCTGNPNQRWVLETNGRITTGLSATKCLDGQNGGALGANVGISDCTGALNQRWAFVGNTLVNDANDLCLAAENSGVVPGTELVLATCDTASTAQQWKVAKWQVHPSQRLRNTAIDRCVLASGNILSDGRSVTDWTCDDSTTAGWYLDPNGLMINRAGLSWCMDGGNGSANQTVRMRQCQQSNTSQRWTYDAAAKQLKNNTNNLCLSRLISSDILGSNTILAACASVPNQQFELEPTGEWVWQQIRNTVTGNCAVVANTNSGTKLQTEPCDSNDAGQRWYLDVGGRLHPRASQGTNGSCVDGNNNGTANNEVIMWGCNTQPWQKWIADAGAQTLVNDANDLCVEASGTGLRLQVCSGIDAQRWVVEPQ